MSSPRLVVFKSIESLKGDSDMASVVLVSIRQILLVIVLFLERILEK